MFKIELIDAVGKLCLSIESTDKIKTLDIAQLQAGWYTLRIVETNGTVEDYKFIKE